MSNADHPMHRKDEQERSEGQFEAQPTPEKSLNRRIAEALGFRVKKAQKRTNYWLLLAPNGHEYSGRLYGADWAAWDDAPDYEHSLDAAWKLFASLPDDCTPRLVRMINAEGALVYAYKAGVIDHKQLDDFETWSKSPASAVAECWLKWKAAQHD